MRYLKGIMWFVLVITISGAVTADVVIDNQSIPGNEIQSITISPTSGDIFISTKTGYVVTPGDVAPPPPGAVTVDISASPSTILTGQSTLISWTSQNASSGCVASGGTSDWTSSVAQSGSENIVITTLGIHTFILQCTGESGTVQDQVSVTVNDSPPPPTTDNCDPSSLSGITREWSSFWSTSFPNPIYDNVITEVPRNGYLAIKFNTANYVDTGLLTAIETTSTSGRRIGSISQCPGDFNVANECQHVWGVGGGLLWSTAGYPKSCILQPDTTYYFNITFTDGINPSSSECHDTICMTKLRANNPVD